jgi:hypothetical protein
MPRSRVKPEGSMWTFSPSFESFCPIFIGLSIKLFFRIWDDAFAGAQETRAPSLESVFWKDLTVRHHAATKAQIRDDFADCLAAFWRMFKAKRETHLILSMMMQNLPRKISLQIVFFHYDIQPDSIAWDLSRTDKDAGFRNVARLTRRQKPLMRVIGSVVAKETRS